MPEIDYKTPAPQYLYHGVWVGRLPGILKYGLLPPKQEWVHTHEFARFEREKEVNTISLADTEQAARFFAVASAMEHSERGKGRIEDFIILRIDTTKNPYPFYMITTLSPTYRGNEWITIWPVSKEAITSGRLVYNINGDVKEKVLTFEEMVQWIGPEKVEAWRLG